VTLNQTIYQIEQSLRLVPAEKYAAVLSTSGAKAEVLAAAGVIKHWQESVAWRLYQR